MKWVTPKLGTVFQISFKVEMNSPNVAASVSLLVFAVTQLVQKLHKACENTIPTMLYNKIVITGYAIIYIYYV